MAPTLSRFLMTLKGITTPLLHKFIMFEQYIWCRQTSAAALINDKPERHIKTSPSTGSKSQIKLLPEIVTCVNL